MVGDTSGLELFCWIVGGVLMGIGLIGVAVELVSAMKSQADSTQTPLGWFVAAVIGGALIGICKLAKALASYLQ